MKRKNANLLTFEQKALAIVLTFEHITRAQGNGATPNPANAGRTVQMSLELISLILQILQLTVAVAALIVSLRG